MRTFPRHLSRLAAIAALSLMCVAGAAVLPDDRADVFWSSYRGGGMDITGESVLVRKKFSEQFAVEGNYLHRQGQRRLHRRLEPGQRHQG